MRIFIHSKRSSQGASALVRGFAPEIEVFRLRRDTLPSSLRPWQAGDLVVNWGDSISGTPEMVRVLNPRIIGNKLRELTRLELKDVKCPKFDLTQHEGWLPRALHHTGGHDLLIPPARPAYWVEKLHFFEEFRIHVFNGVSIRAGIKRPRVAMPHQWIRSYDAGWSIYYDALAHEFMRDRHRNLAKKALVALGYDFGAVDIGVLPTGTPVVLEVNSAPGLEGNTLGIYVRKILQLVTN